MKHIKGKQTNMKTKTLVLTGLLASSIIVRAAEPVGMAKRTEEIKSLK